MERRLGQEVYRDKYKKKEWFKKETSERKILEPRKRDKAREERVILGKRYREKAKERGRE